MKFSEVVALLEEINKTNSSLEKTRILSHFLKKCNKEDIYWVSHLVRGKIFSDINDKQLGVANNLMIKAISLTTGVSEKKIKDYWRITGDLGDAAEKAVKQKTQHTLYAQNLTLSRIVENLNLISTLEGAGTVSKKIALINELLTNATPIEAKYVVRMILGKLRLGVGNGVLRDSISKAFNIPKEVVERAYDMMGDFGEVARISLLKGEKGLKNISLRVGTPIQSMLYIKVNSIKEAFKVVGKPAIIEYKFDGLRTQIHYDKKKNILKIFTRRLEDVTKQFPDIAEYMKKNLKCESCILDSETVGLTRDKKTFIPFQKLSRRIKRKYHIEKMVKEMPVKTFVFDCLYINGESLMDKPLEKRIKFLSKIIKPNQDLRNCPRIITSDEKKAEDFFNKALSEKQEGVMIKSLKARYQPGKRVGYGVKLKPGLESFDLVIVGAEWGQGKRNKFLSSYLLACKHPKKEEFLTIGKLSSGPTEEQYEEITRLLKPLILKTKGREVIVKPQVIVEVNYQEIQESPKYSSGFALRFPTLKQVRYEKSLNEVDDLNKVKFNYESQFRGDYERKFKKNT